MTLADTPKNWPNGPGISTLHVLLLFAGIPLLVIIGVSLLVLAPGWVRGPRYRPGQPWAAKTEWFGPEPRPATAGEPAPSQPESGTSTATSPQDRRTIRGGSDSGGASAGW